MTVRRGQATLFFVIMHGGSLHSPPTSRSRLLHATLPFIALVCAKCWYWF